MRISKRNWGYGLDGKMCPYSEEDICGEWCPLFEYINFGHTNGTVHLYCGNGRTISVVENREEIK